MCQKIRIRNLKRYYVLYQSFLIVFKSKQKKAASNRPGFRIKNSQTFMKQPS